MSVDRNRPSGRRRQSEFDRRAIGVAGHLLVAGIWLERQLVNAPRVLLGQADVPHQRTSVLPRPRPSLVTLMQTGGEELR